MAIHAKLGASSSPKWLPCSGALALEAAVGKPDKGSSFANEGTVAHHVGAECLQRDMNPSQFLNGVYEVQPDGEVRELDDDPNGETSFKVNQEMVDALDIYVGYIRDLNGVSSFIEEKVDYSHIVPEGFGTADAVIEVYEKVMPDVHVNTLYVCDLKYGKGIKVDAFENTQAMLYALGSLNSLDFLFERGIDKIVCVIIQPRIDHIGEFEISVEDLNKWAEEVARPKGEKAAKLLHAVTVAMEDGKRGRDAANLIPPEAFNPTDKGCQWCKAKGTCKARANQGYESAIEGFENLDTDEKVDLTKIEVSKDTLRNINVLSNTELGAIYDKMKLFTKWMKDLKDNLLERLEAGEKVDGYKLVQGKPGNRTWSDAEMEETIKHIRTSGLQKKDYLIETIISPTVAEELLKANKPKDHAKRYKKLADVAIYRPEGKNAIAPESDKREAIVLVDPEKEQEEIAMVIPDDLLREETAMVIPDDLLS